jgi:uncharacterized protein YneF (UPF0154 family)
MDVAILVICVLLGLILGMIVAMSMLRPTINA